MKKSILLFMAGLLAIACRPSGENFTQYVDTHIGTGGHGQTLLHQFQVQVAVLRLALGLIPNPGHMTAAAGIALPLVIVRLDDNRFRVRQLLTGEVGCPIPRSGRWTQGC